MQAILTKDTKYLGQNFKIFGPMFQDVLAYYWRYLEQNSIKI